MILVTAKLYNDSLICSVHGITVKSTKPLVYKPKHKDLLSFSIYPNPTSTTTNVQISKILNKELTFVVLDILGREVYIEKRLMDTNRFSIDTRKWSDGVFLLQILDGKEIVFKSPIQVLK